MFATPKYTPTPKKLRRQNTVLSSKSSNSDKDPVQVYCRLRPIENELTSPCMKLISAQELQVFWETKGIQKEVIYKFRHIFTAYTNQKEVFDHLAYPLLEELLKGKNGLLFTYGVTGSGKTYTLTGDQNNPGILPRCIDTIFNSVGDYQTAKFLIKPDRMNGFEIQTEEDANHDRMCEIRTLSRTPQKKGSTENINFNNDGTRIPVLNESNLFAVFISYIEIYNNNVYDLLDGSGNEPKLQSKILREDFQRNMYVNGVVEIEVKSAQDAFDVLAIGLKKKKMAHTILNAESSRSHSVFNIRVVQLEKQIYNGDGKQIIPEKNMIQIGQLSLVDLAGSERSNRTQNTGARLKEASCINNSLMSLRSCLEMLRENQRLKTNKVVPYRDSRLTYLFKNYFEGNGSVQMVVCVNPSLDDLEENLHVMKFAELSQDVKITRSVPKYTPITSKKVISKRKATPATINSANVFSALPQIPIYKFSENVEECGLSIDRMISFWKTAGAKRVAATQEFEHAHEEFRKKLTKVHEEAVLNKTEVKSYKQLCVINRQKIHNLELKLTDLETVNDSLAGKNEELQDVIRSLNNKISEKDLKLNQNMMEREKIKQKAALATVKMGQELDAKLKKQRDHLNAAMKAKNIQLENVKKALETEVIVGVNAIVDMESARENLPPQTPKSPPSNGTHRRNVPINTPHRRRSRSAGEMWLEHNSVKPIPLGTVMQPSIKKRKSVTKLTKATDVTNPKQSKYCLVAQEHDTDGEMETKVYKGDIVPTCGGGAQVIFNDVERLRQESPTASPMK